MKLIKKLGSLKLTIFLLIFLAVASVLGTLIAQQQDDHFYVQNYGKVFAKAISTFQINDFYNSLFYNCLLFSLGANLFVCTLNSCSLAMLKNRRKLALFLLHCSILVIFLGAIVSKFSKYSEYRKLYPGDAIAINEQNAELVFREFAIDYYEERNQPKEYRSTFSLKQPDNPEKDIVIRVNHPFQFANYNFYQSGFEVVADIDVRIKHMGKVVYDGNWKQGEVLELPTEMPIQLEIVCFIPEASIDEQANITLVSYKPKNPAIMVNVFNDERFIQSQWIFFNQQNDDMQQQLFDFEIRDFRVLYATIIHVLKDPGLKFVWIGFLMLFSGMIVLIFSKKF